MPLLHGQMILQSELFPSCALLFCYFISFHCKFFLQSCRCPRPNATCNLQVIEKRSADRVRERDGGAAETRQRPGEFEACALGCYGKCQGWCSRVQRYWQCCHTFVNRHKYREVDRAAQRPARSERTPCWWKQKRFRRKGRCFDACACRSSRRRTLCGDSLRIQSHGVPMLCLSLKQCE